MAKGKKIIKKLCIVSETCSTWATEYAQGGCACFGAPICVEEGEPNRKMEQER